MGKYRDHREPRRRGFDEDSNDQEPEPSYFLREPTKSPTAMSSPPVDVEVLWFNVDKGFGFVKLADGSDAFLHVRALESAGHRVVSEGMKLTVRIGEGQKGPQVAEVLEVSSGNSSGTDRPSYSSLPSSKPDSPGEESAGSVKWYNADKGFGFIALEGGSKDVFVHVSTLKQCGLEFLEEGQRVVVTCGQGQKGPEVRSVRLD